MTDAELLARATVWAGSEPRAADGVYDITNGDQLRWRQLWPAFTRHFGMEYAEPQPVPLVEAMSQHRDVWQRLVSQHGLVQTPLHRHQGGRHRDVGRQRTLCRVGQLPERGRPQRRRGRREQLWFVPLRTVRLGVRTGRPRRQRRGRNDRAVAGAVGSCPTPSPATISRPWWHRPRRLPGEVAAGRMEP